MKPAQEQLIKFISERISISTADVKLLKHCFKYGYFEKGALLEKENAVAKNLYYLTNGFVRIFCYHNGEEVTTQITGSNNFITSFNSFVTGTASQENVRCITACEVLYVTKAEYDNLYLKIPNWEKFCRKIYEKVIELNLQRTKDLLSLSAEIRYLTLMSTRPEIAQHVPIQYIASYIGVKPESLSRIRKKIIS